MRKQGRIRRIVIVLAAGSMVLSACGLKADVKQSLRASGGRALAPGQFVDPNTGQVVDESGNVVDPGVVDPGTGTVTDPGTGTNNGSTPNDPTNPNPTTGPTQTAQPTGPVVPPPGAGNTTGIRGGKLHIALHGPLTGAGVPQESFRSGAGVYWETHKIRGMEVVASVFDDEYNPSGAIKACRRAAPDNFLIVGGAGTDQIQACAKDQVVQRGGVPYISAGVTENGLHGLSNYFAASMTYRQQGPTVVKMAREKGFLQASKGWGLVISSTPNFKDAKESIEAALNAAGIKHTYYPVPKTGGDATNVANQLRAAGHETVYFLGQPLFFTEIVQRVGCPQYCPTFTGPGIAMGVNTVANLACANSAGFFKGFYLSPYPGWDDRAKYAPGVQLDDDIEFTIYGVMQALHQMFDSVPANQPLTRESFIAAVARGSYKGGIFNPAVFAGKTRFGGTKAYYLRANCDTRRWETAGGPTA